MTINNWKVQPADVLNASPVMPVMVIQDAADAVPLARALMAGGINVLEITLRTAAAMDAIRAISSEVEGAIVGAGTITTPEELKAVADADVEGIDSMFEYLADRARAGKTGRKELK